jgi:hypothetical protein
MGGGVCHLSIYLKCLWSTRTIVDIFHLPSAQCDQIGQNFTVWATFCFCFGLKFGLLFTEAVYYKFHLN